MNAMCDNNLACAKTCMGHVTTQVAAEDVARWQQCTYSATCSGIQTYVQKAECADRSVGSLPTFVKDILLCETIN